MKYYWTGKEWSQKPTRPALKHHLGIKVFDGAMNNGLGAKIGSHQDRRDALNKIKEQTGSEPIEIGSEKMSIKPKQSNYNFSKQDYAVFDRILNGE